MAPKRTSTTAGLSEEDSLPKRVRTAPIATSAPAENSDEEGPGSGSSMSDESHFSSSSSSYEEEDDEEADETWGGGWKARLKGKGKKSGASNSTTSKAKDAVRSTRTNVRSKPAALTDEGDSQGASTPASATGAAGTSTGIKLKLKLPPKPVTYDDDYTVAAPPLAMPTTGALKKRVQVSDTEEGNRSSHNDFRSLHLKSDHASRPLYICPSKHYASIILEAFHPLSSQAQDFLITIAEPISRPSHIHEYRLTPYSLYAAVSVGLKTEDIVEVLNRLSKIPVPKNIVEFIRDCTLSYGKCKLVLKKNRYWVESADPEVLRMLLRDKVIGEARKVGEQEENGELEKDKAPKKAGLVIPGTTTTKDKEREKEDSNGIGEGPKKTAPSDADLFKAVVGLDRDDEMDEDEAVHSFEIVEDKIESVKKRCNELEYPMLEEYDFKNDLVNPNLDIDLKPTTTIRPYQEKSLSKMFGNGRARSGIIVLPCGAGKTLVGITAACTIRKSVLVLCTSGVSVMQWKQEFLKWSNVQEKQIAVFTADQKEKFEGASGIVVSTYSMVANRQKRAHDAQKMMDFLQSREWGFILLDEVHVVPAAMFRRVVTTIKAHAKLGLTATLVREDEKIDELNFLVGPKLYEANWMDLAQKGHIANVQCAEVWCEMPPEFYREYLRDTTRKRMLLHCMNPKKFQACQYLIKIHEDRGDKIIVFSDNVYALEAYAKRFKKPFIHGATSQVERMRILQNFQGNANVNTIFLSKVGDTSIDLPEATCLIQISSHFGSRRQEAQRLGRILRAKRRNDEGFNAYFYSLVSRDTQEMYYSTKRQQFLIDQGYYFKIITHLSGIEKLPDLVYPTRSEQIELLQSVLLAKDTDANIAGDMKAGDGDHFEPLTVTGRGGFSKNKVKAKRVVGNIDALSGAASMSYVERNRSENKKMAKPSQKERHKLFEKRDQLLKEKAKEKRKAANR